MIVFCVAAERTERLDRFLADQLALSRTQAGRLIADKRVSARGKPLRASALLERGTEVTVEFAPDDPPPEWKPTDLTRQNHLYLPKRTIYKQNLEYTL